MIKPSALLAPVADAANAAKRVSIDVLHGSALADARRALVRGAKGTGLVKEATTLEKAIDAVEHDARVVEDIEKVLLKERSGLRSMAALLNAATPPRPSRLDRLFALIAERDRIALGLLAERLMKAGEGITLARVNNMAGALREVVAKWLPEVLIEVERAAAALRKKA